MPYQNQGNGDSVKAVEKVWRLVELEREGGSCWLVRTRILRTVGGGQSSSSNEAGLRFSNTIGEVSLFTICLHRIAADAWPRSCEVPEELSTRITNQSPATASATPPGVG